MVPKLPGAAGSGAGSAGLVGDLHPTLSEKEEATLSPGPPSTQGSPRVGLPMHTGPGMPATCGFSSPPHRFSALSAAACVPQARPLVDLGPEPAALPESERRMCTGLTTVPKKAISLRVFPFCPHPKLYALAACV